MQIETQIPIPKKPTWKADLDKMKVNQSTLVPITHKRTVRAAISRHFNGKNLKAFVTAKAGEKYMRVWRVS